jgi:formylglycine-generating enzyme required for sulfatase activity
VARRSNGAVAGGYALGALAAVAAAAGVAAVWPAALLGTITACIGIFLVVLSRQDWKPRRRRQGAARRWTWLRFSAFWLGCGITVLGSVLGLRGVSAPAPKNASPAVTTSGSVVRETRGSLSQPGDAGDASGDQSVSDQPDSAAPGQVREADAVDADRLEEVDAGPGAGVEAAAGSTDACSRCSDWGMVTIPPGKVLVGYEHERDPRDAPCIPELRCFCIDRTEVTLLDYDRYFAAVNQNPQALPGATFRYANWKLHDDDKYVARPVNGVTWQQASDYCTWRGKRLCAETEWERAARGSTARRFPWGDEPIANCSLAVMVSRSTVEGEAPLCGCDREATADVGSLQYGDTPEGVSDLAGNVAEWVGPFLGGTYASGCDHPPIPVEGSSVVVWENCGSVHAVRGGSFCHDVAGVQARTRTCVQHERTRSMYQRGIRCCWDPSAQSQPTVFPEDEARVRPPRQSP